MENIKRAWISIYLLFHKMVHAKYRNASLEVANKKPESITRKYNQNIDFKIFCVYNFFL